jgi:NAD(P)-dependent dehydrogenase (short-subunit alcohol dehydrogenase family)
MRLPIARGGSIPDLSQVAGSKMDTFEGKTAVITGAASGIGSGLARKALALGMRVVLADNQAAQLDSFARTLSGEILAVPTDVADPGSVEALAEKAYAAFGSIELLFNNAGIMATGFSWEIEPDRWRRSVDVNFFGVLHGVRSFVPRMLKSGGAAHIVNTASVGGFLASPLMAPYSATKYAVVALSESLRAELEMIQAPIGVSLLAPGPVDTGIFNDPFGKVITPEIQKFVDQLRHMLSHHGLSPDAFAELVFAGVAADQFWLIPQPEAFDERYRMRVEEVLARRNPVLAVAGQR